MDDQCQYLIAGCTATHVTDEFKAFITPDNINAMTTLGGGFTPLKMACFYSYTAVVKWLLENGADPNVSCREGYRPLHSLCAGYGSLDPESSCAMLLLAAGAHVNALTISNHTPLNYMHVDKYNATAFMLIHAGACLNKYPYNNHRWIDVATAAREQCRSAARFFAGLSLRRILPKDIAVLLGKFIWASRGEWMEAALAEHAQNYAK